LTLSQLEGLGFYFISFIDILGFSNMVKSDFESSSKNMTYIKKLFNIYNYTSNLKESILGLKIIQFSDSVVLSVPYSEELFSQFISIIAKYQYDLFCEGILCRGGIAYGKHFLHEGFVFSNGLIDAYRIESDVAKYPRIVVSDDLINLIYKNGEIDKSVPLIKENDGLFFVDFLEGRDLIASSENLKSILDMNKSSSVSIKEKQRWLTEYFDFKASQSNVLVNNFGQPRFLKLNRT
jgi:hypothetical protein